ncbi:hypothetical protein GGR57DRAFT_508146 [Xylariaceae sp. FL1272]|nr:hypothetical protein GGR57DRAFT_508146 [Xylariaceae sp. FL1272]
MIYSSALAAAVLAVTAAAMPSKVTISARADSTTTPDIDAIKAVPQSSFTSYQTGGLVRASLTNSTVEKRWTCATTLIFTWGDEDTGGTGITINNADSNYQGFYIYYNNCDTIPWKYIWIAGGGTEFVSIPDDFQGRVVRGIDSQNLDGQSHTLGSWLELGHDSSGLWGDVSLIRGCDGGILMWTTDGSNAWKGFTQWILDGAPDGAYDEKTDGQWVIKYTENLDGSINTVPRDWEIQQVGADYVYVDDDHGSPVILGSNSRFATYWPSGRP